MFYFACVRVFRWVNAFVVAAIAAAVGAPIHLCVCVFGERTLKSKMEVRKSSSTSWNLIAHFYCLWVCLYVYWNIFNSNNNNQDSSPLYTYKPLGILLYWNGLYVTIVLSFSLLPLPSLLPSLPLSCFIHSNACVRVKECACLYMCINDGQCSLDWEINYDSREVARPLRLSPHTSHHITSHLFSSLVLKAIVSTSKVPKASLRVTWIITSFNICVRVCVPFGSTTHIICA